MGEDFIRKTERTYRRSVQRTIQERLFAPALFQPAEIGTTLYPCRLNGSDTLDVQTEYLLHRRDRDTLEVLAAHRAIGNVQGEALHDLNQIFDGCPNAGGILRIVVQQQHGDSLEFTLHKEG